MGNLNASRIIITSLACGAAAFMGFLIQEPASRVGDYSQGDQNVLMVFTHAMVMFATLSLLISAALVIVEEISTLSPKRILTRLSAGLLVGGFCGALGGAAGQLLFALMLGAGGRNVVVLICARTLGWGLVGAGIGLAGGVPSLSWRKSLQGTIGGLIGGWAGGFAFDVVSLPFHSGTVSRMLGAIAIGLCVGAAVMLIEEVAKVAWVTVVVGRNEGKQYIITKPVTRIGRDELSDIPLYGDTSVAKHHATIQTSDWRTFTFCDAGGTSGSWINGQYAQQQPLRDGDVIQVSRFQLIFGCRARTGLPYSTGYSSTPPQPYSPAPPGTQVYQAPYGQPPAQQYQPSGPSVCPFCGQLPDSAGTCACTPVTPQVAVQTITNAELVGVAGPYNGVTFTLDGDSISIGRDPSNTIALEQDGGVSRKHATICVESGRIVVRDESSTNGTFVNGVRVQTQTLNPGDIVHFGSSSFRFRAATS